ncbi:MAG: hypothetical protein AB8B64_11175 [Granulosicoccus sp.]
MQTRNSKRVNVITGLIGVSLFAIFIIGLVHSVATGFAGFEGALPLILISAFVLCLLAYDFFDQAIRGRNQNNRR